MERARMSGNELSVFAVPKNLGPKLDLLLVMHMGWEHWSENELSF
jgi:hypothetical protein